MPDDPSEQMIGVGQAVEVHVRYDNSWSSGFEVAEVVDERFRLRRRSDGSLLPSLTGRADLRLAPIAGGLAGR